MIHILFNALAASAGAGPTYVRNIIPEIARRSDVRATIVLTPSLRQEFATEISNIAFEEMEATGTFARAWREQTALPPIIRSTAADVLVSTGNFALRRSPVPQILLSGNSLYISRDFYQDVASRRDYRLWVDTRLKAFLAHRSVQWADVTIAPSHSFAERLRGWTRHEVTSIYHGFNRELFFGDASFPPAEIQRKIDGAGDALKLLFVSHYNYYRNFETLLRAVPLIRQGLKGRRVKLFLTCELQSEKNPGSYRMEVAAGLIRELGIGEELEELGAVQYRQLHHVYRAADIYITPAYTETFAHPLVEAMASGVPIVASDIAVHREICDGSGVFFDRFSSAMLAEQVLKVASCKNLALELKNKGLRRSSEFSWRQHLDSLVGIAKTLHQGRVPEKVLKD
jgi:glycosyltransferase involved in cell wall biosynthesis